MLKTIRIEVIPHGLQRYSTTGDWYFVRKSADISDPTRPIYTEELKVRVSKMPDEKFEQLVGVHEVIESLLCRAAGIDENVVSKFDTLYEDARIAKDPATDAARTQLLRDFCCTCKITDESEPGDDSHAPYYRQHQLATSVERMMAAEMGVSWMEYEQANLDLYKPFDLATAVAKATVAGGGVVHISAGTYDLGCANAQPPDVALEDATIKLATVLVGANWSKTYVADVLRRYADAIRNR